MKSKRFIILFIAAVMMVTSGLWTQRYGNGKGFGNQDRGNRDMLNELLNNMPKQSIEQDEADGLILMAEEEKLARDVYLKLAEIWDLPIFGNIAQSEDRHMQAVLTLISKYELQSPINSNESGVFTNPKFRELYDTLVLQGSSSLLDALIVGATIEDLDIADLQDFLTRTDNEDIKMLYQNLIKGSRNHMRSFYQRILQYGGNYDPQYIQVSEFESIINSPMERGFNNGNGRPFYGDQGW